jgi:RecA/RadA recombinase
VERQKIGGVVTSAAVNALRESILSSPQVAGRVLTPEQFSENFTVLEVKPLALQWLLDSNGIFLGKTFQFIGETSSCKSQFLYEMGAMFMESGGFFILVETENKTSPSTLRARFGDLMDCGRFLFHQVDLLDVDKDDKGEPWQKAVSHHISILKKHNLTYVPTLIGVDSLVGTGSAESNKQINDDGSAQARSTAGMSRAASNTRYILKITKDLVDTGITLAITNHKKISVNTNQPSYMPDKGTYGGGDAVGFQCAMMMDFSRSTEQKGINDAGRYVSISMRKASFGKDFQRIRVPFDVKLERDESGELVLNEHEEPVRVIEWGWDEALTLLLEEFCVSGSGDDKKGRYYSKAARDILPIEKTKAGYSCKPYGLENLSAKEFGAAVQANRQIVTALMTVPRFNINRYSTVVPAKPV